LVGPSFGWQHLRLYINHSNSPFSPSPGEPLTDHPSYQAQLDGILEMLSLLKLSKEGKKIEEQWSSILQIYDHQRPQGYELYYPSELIHGIAKTVYFSCRRYGLVPFSDKSHKPAINLITTAWEQFLSAPSNYPKWEKDSLEKFFSV
jgi:hypothetical protein